MRCSGAGFVLYKCLLSFARRNNNYSVNSGAVSWNARGGVGDLGWGGVFCLTLFALRLKLVANRPQCLYPANFSWRIRQDCRYHRFIGACR